MLSKRRNGGWYLEKCDFFFSDIIFWLLSFVYCKYYNRFDSICIFICLFWNEFLIWIFFNDIKNLFDEELFLKDCIFNYNLLLINGFILLLRLWN